MELIEKAAESSRIRLKISSLAVSLALLTLFGCSGEAATQTTTTTTTTTVVLEKPFGVPLLIQALPSALELPSGWTASGTAENSVSDTLDPQSGKGFGVCGGPNRDMLLQQFGVVAWAWSPSLKPERGGNAYLGIFEFPTADAAKNFIERNASQASCGSLTHTAVEVGDGVTPSKNSKTPRIDIFSGSDNSSKWEVRDSYTVGGRLSSSMSTGITTQTDTEYLAKGNGKSYGGKERNVVAYEQYLNVVVRYNMFGECCIYGFSNSEARTEDSRSSLTDLNAMAELFRPRLLEKLGLSSLPK